MKCVNIYYYDNNCTPFVRRILESVYMLADTKVAFHLAFDLTDRGKEAKDMAALINAINLYNCHTELMTDKKLMESLQELVDCSIDDIKKAIAAVFAYWYSNPNEQEEEICEAYIDQWKSIYGVKSKVALKDSAVVINSVNKNEIKTYLDLFQQEILDEGNKMTAATETLLATIPCDVESIADIGCGPGLVNRFIPYYYNVLGVDIDEKILSQCKCKTVLGDILALPIESEAVDMALSSDVLEHIEEQSLAQAVAELKRIAKKYIYIQVPYEEILRYGVVKCKSCGHIWHVNHHKSTFDLDRLKTFQDNDWKICRVNFSGNVSNYMEPAEVYNFIDENSIEIYRVEGAVCPICAAISENIHFKKLLKYTKKAMEKKLKRAIRPVYSEIGVLLKKGNIELKQRENKQVFSLEKRNNAEINFIAGFAVHESYIGIEQVPTLISTPQNFECCPKGVRLAQGYATIVYPFDIAGCRCIIKGECVRSTTVGVYLVHDDGCEVLQCVVQCKPGIINLECRLSPEKQQINVLRIYIDKESTLSSVYVDYQYASEYQHLQGNEQEKHLMYLEDGMQYCKYIPEVGLDIGGDTQVREAYALLCASNIDFSGSGKKIEQQAYRLQLSASAMSGRGKRYKLLYQAKSYGRNILKYCGIYLVNKNPRIYRCLRNWGIDKIYKKLMGVY